MSPVWAARVRLTVTAVLVAGVAIALVSATSRAREVSWPAWGAVITSVVLVGATLLAGAASWSTMFPEAASRIGVARAFLIGQLGKYVPGGVVQVASVVDLTRRAGVGGRHVAVALPTHALSAIVAPGLIVTAVLAVIDQRLPDPLRITIVLSTLAVAVAMLRRNWLAVLLDFVHRRWARVPDGSHVPATSTLVIAAAFGFGGFVAYGSAFAVLLAPSGGWRPFAVVAGGFVVAFIAGFLALPVPSGVGIREAVLVATVGTIAPLADILAAAVVLRVAQLGAELAIIVAASAAHRVAGGRNDAGSA